MAAASVPSAPSTLTERQLEFLNTARTSGYYPHKREFQTVQELQSVEVIARGFSWSFGWALGARDRYFEERFEELTVGFLEQLKAREAWRIYAFGRLEVLHSHGLPLDETTWEALLNFDHMVKVTETLLGIHALLSQPTEVGTFGIPRPHTRATLLERLVAKLEVPDIGHVRGVYTLALEVFEKGSK